MDEDPQHPVVLFDGVCNLCAGSVRFVIDRDPEGVFRFAPLQSAVGERLLDGAGFDEAHENLDSVVLVEDGKAYTKSDAVIRIAARLGGPYRLLSPFRYVPKRARDAVYEFVAANRYDWFGKRDRCLLPTPELESRFLARDERSPETE